MWQDKKLNQRGFALLLMMAMLLVLTVLATEIFTESRLAHEEALRTRDRLQAYYLARSGQEFAKLILFYNNKIAAYVQGQSVVLPGESYVPLYKQIPINTALIRLALNSASVESVDPQEAATNELTNETETDVDEISPTEDPLSGVGMLSQDKLKDFLGFKGDFDVVFSEENGKISMQPTQQTPEYQDVPKMLLKTFLTTMPLSFELSENDLEDFIFSIYDYSDVNSQINEWGGLERGQESSDYREEQGLKNPKNAKYLSVAELHLLPKMNDELFSSLEAVLSPYNTTNLFNPCLAAADLVKAAILFYSQNAGCVAPLRDEAKEELETIYQATVLGCPDLTMVNNNFKQALGLNSATGDAESPACGIDIDKIFNGDSHLIRVQSFGRVGEVTREINTVLVTQGDPKDWGIVYRTVF